MQKRSGFTLIELSIVIVVISLIVTGVVAGQKLVRQSKIKSALKYSETIISAVHMFKLKYDYLPGDMPNASDRWSGVSNGNGNGQIDETKGMAQLVASGLIKTALETNDCSWTKIPGPGGSCFRITSSSSVDSVDKNFVMLDNFWNVTDAYNADLKLDDGKPFQGKHWGYSFKQPTYKCTDPVHNNGSANVNTPYNLSGDNLTYDQTCSLGIKLDY